MNNQTLESSYRYCFDITKNHYENFPVASLLIPKNKRKYIAAVYAFARIADDIADEGNLSSATRIAKLIKYKDLFINGLISDEFPNLPAIYDSIEKNNLSNENFVNLIEAFIQDNLKNKYQTFDEVLNYCKKSANPVGRILLELFDIRSEEAFEYSDSICTALQLTNFYQDLSIDISKERFYISQDLLRSFNLSIDELKTFYESKTINDNFKLLMEHLIELTNDLFSKGEKLIPILNGLFKFEIKLTILGGREILSKIRKLNYNPFRSRPTLKKFDWIKLLLGSLYK